MKFRWLIILPIAAVIAIGAVIGIQTFLNASKLPSSLSSAAVSAQFNFRVAGLPVPGWVTDKDIMAKVSFNPSDLSHAMGTVKVNLGNLQTGIALRDQHAKEALKTKEYPEAIFVLKQLNGAKTLQIGQINRLIAEGTFSLGGISHPIQSPVTVEHKSGKTDQFIVMVSLNVKLADYKIMVIGADPIVDVKVKFELTQI